MRLAVLIRLSAALSLAAVLATCTPPRNIQYCQGYGLSPNTRDWNDCMDHFARNETAFQTERGDCAAQADAYYPPYLYDYGHYETYQTFGRYGFGHSEHIFIPGDYRHNAGVDGLRARIIEPCMQSKGWNTARGWEYGRRTLPLTPVRH